jgi:hypothetical protein
MFFDRPVRQSSLAPVYSARGTNNQTFNALTILLRRSMRDA